MKPSINKSTDTFLESLGSRVEEDVVNYFSGKDELDRIILKGGLKIRNIYLDKPMDLMIIVLNNKKILKRKISEFKHLQDASPEQLNKFTNNGFGIHWILLDYDLSLKGFLEYELTFIDRPFSI
jgi:hypothetical protein